MRSIFALEVDDESGTIYADQRDLATYQVMGLEGIHDNGQSVILADVSKGAYVRLYLTRRATRIF
jgi:hypothetical protein